MTFTTRFGSDIGNVLSSTDPDAVQGGDFADLVRSAVEIPGAFDALAEINDLTGGDAVLISKCSEPVEAAVNDWLLDMNLTRRTGIPMESVYYVRQRSEKAVLAERFKLRYFVDDRFDVLKAMTRVRCRILFKPKRRDALRRQQEPQGIALLETWPGVVRYVKHTL